VHPSSTVRAGAFLLVGGGINSGTVLATHPAALSQRFDPVRGEFVRSGDLKRVRSGDATATLLADGRVLVTGGGSLAAPFSETYDPATEQWTIGENLLVGRRGHTGPCSPTAGCSSLADSSAAPATDRSSLT